MKKSELRQMIMVEIKNLNETITKVKLMDINFDDYHIGDSIKLPSPTQADAYISIRDFQKGKVEDWKKEWKKHWGNTIFQYDSTKGMRAFTVVNNPKYDAWKQKRIKCKCYII